MSGPYAAMKIRDFRLFISARFCITLAIQIQAVVVGWQVYEITRDPLSLGLIGLAEAIPSIAVSLYAGHVADVTSRKKIILITVATLVLCSGLLLFFTINIGSFLLSFGVLPIYAVIFVSGIAHPGTLAVHFELDFGFVQAQIGVNLHKPRIFCQFVLKLTHGLRQVLVTLGGDDDVTDRALREALAQRRRRDGKSGDA